MRAVVGTSADTPITLRLKAAELPWRAGARRNETAIEALKRLSAPYPEAAGKMATGRAGAPPASEARAG